MPDTPQQKPAKTESFVGNVMKYSVATYLGFLISGAALIIKGILPAELHSPGLGLFLFGEVCTVNDQAEFGNLMLSKLRITKR